MCVCVRTNIEEVCVCDFSNKGFIIKMGKRHYCDYCDTSYPYSVEARKKHAQGHLHQKLKKLHYEHFKTAKEKLKIELQREKCRSFHSGRQCLYGDSCIYSHLTATDMEILKREAHREAAAIVQSKRPTLLKNGCEPTVEGWMSSLDDEEQKIEKSMDTVEEFQAKYQLSECLKAYTDLPPSVIPPTADNLLACDFQDWG